MPKSRREFLAKLTAVLAAPAVVEEGEVMRFFRSLKEKPLRYKGPIKIPVAVQEKTFTPIEWYQHTQSPEIKELVLKKLKEDIDRMVKQMNYETNRWCVGDKSVKPQIVTYDYPRSPTKFGKES